jgi:hypothetical protein
MSDHDVTRREFLERAAILGAAFGAAPLLAACASSEEGAATGDDVAAGPIDCTDTSALTEDEVKTRTDLEYVEMSEMPDQNCLNCEQYDGDATACGACTLVPGPINPEGWCISWVEVVA